MKERKPKRDHDRYYPNREFRVLVCDDNGYINIETVKKDWLQYWKTCNRTTLVAWMPLPDWPEELCLGNADGEIP